MDILKDSNSFEMSRSEFIYTKRCNHLLEELHDMFKVIATFAELNKEYKTSKLIKELLTKEVSNPLTYYRFEDIKKTSMEVLDCFEDVINSISVSNSSSFLKILASVYIKTTRDAIKNN